MEEEIRIGKERIERDRDKEGKGDDREREGRLRL